MQNNQKDEKIYRADIAAWYNITERCLRDRMQKAQVHIVNRVLTDDDIRVILKNLGKPQSFPLDLYNRFLSDNVT
jgi:hypothetical protein